jgi:NhaP-type Na+/H+ or K+/H+ antiporter
MEWGLLVVAVAVLGYAALSRFLAGTVVSAAIVFVAVGVLAGPEALDLLDIGARSETVRLLAEATLTLVLFSDASRIDLGMLRRDWTLPARLLGMGLPLTIAFGTLLALPIFGTLSVIEAVVLAICVAPTDAALGQAVVTDERVPGRVREGLNVESGLNDGICVPLLFIALAITAADTGAVTGAFALRTVAEQIGYGVLSGAVVGTAAAWLLAVGVRRDLADTGWVRVGVAATAVATYALADPLGGSGFIAAFVGGVVFGAWSRANGMAAHSSEPTALVEEAGSVLNAATFVVFGAVVLGPRLARLGLGDLVFAALALTVARMVPVAIGMLRSGARPPTVAFLGWFGPRGLASIVFAVIVLDADLDHGSVVVDAVVATVALSVIAHGLSAVPSVARYARWYAAHPRRPDLMESEAVAAQRRRRDVVGHERRATGGSHRVSP